MKDYVEMSRLMERTLHKYMQLEKRARCYGTDIPLTQAEIHTISIIGDYPELNVTRLAKLRGITKGAASQMIYKLVEKGFVEKKVSPVSDTEVCLSLTKDGKIAYESHEKHHQDSGLLFSVRDIPDEQYDCLLQCLKHFDEYLDETLEH